MIRAVTLRFRQIRLAFLFSLGLFLQLDSPAYANHYVIVENARNPKIALITSQDQKDTFADFKPVFEEFLTSYRSLEGSIFYCIVSKSVTEQAFDYIKATGSLKRFEVDQFIANTLLHLPKVTAVAVGLGTAFIAWEFVNSWLLPYAPEFLQPSIPTFSYLVSNSLLEPYLSRIGATLTLWVFWAGKGSVNTALTSSRKVAGWMLELWYVTNQLLNENQQMGRDTLVYALRTLNDSITGIMTDWNVKVGLNPDLRTMEGFRDFCLERLAVTFVNFREIYPDVSPSIDPILREMQARMKILGAVDQSFTRSLLNQIGTEVSRRKLNDFDERYYSSLIRLFFPQTGEPAIPSLRGYDTIAGSGEENNPPVGEGL